MAGSVDVSALNEETSAATAYVSAMPLKYSMTVHNELFFPAGKVQPQQAGGRGSFSASGATVPTKGEKSTGSFSEAFTCRYVRHNTEGELRYLRR